MSKMQAPRRQPREQAMKANAAALQFTDIGPDDTRLIADILPVLRNYDRI